MQQRSTTQALINPAEYSLFQQFLQNACGIQLGPGKEYLVSSRLGGLMKEVQVASLGELLRQLNSFSNSQLKTRVIDAMTTNETFWFRDIGHYILLKETILPELNKERGSAIRIWSAACSSGQEPYNISMIIEEYESQRGRGRPVQIEATDISSKMLAEARAGIYCGLTVERGLSSEQQRRFFTPKDTCLEVRPEVKRRVNFRSLNLANSYQGMGRFDVIFCRNVLIYFSNDLKKDIVERMANALNPGGYLFLGSTESINQLTDRFEMKVGHGGISYRLKS
ncbi:MAG: protein-glutamate O-methyltransferase CheR [Candidatus Thiodiazotropha sp.]|jgi:chemotaxis protein methyltransferase CheR